MAAYLRSETSVSLDGGAADYASVTRATPEFFALLVGVACVASMAPAIKAARVDPAIALRLE
jgi:hypothetical protein